MSKKHPQRVHVKLQLENLEARCLLDAALAHVGPAEIDWPVSIAVLPNDSRFGELYGLNNTGQTGGTVDADIDAPEAWSVFTGSTRVAVGIIDTGIDYRHPDLYLNVWINQGEIPTTLGVIDTDADARITFRDLNNSQNSSRVTDVNRNGYIDAGDLLNDTRWENGQDNDRNGYFDDLVGWDFVNNDNDPLDDNGHGSHVAGTIGAIGNNTLGVVGVNWVTQMAGLKFLNAQGSGVTSNAVKALNYAVMEGIQISNNSWGGGGFSSEMATAISNARAAGHLFVAAAGNSNVNTDVTANYPSNYAYDNVLSVASTDASDRKSSFSNYGATTVDLAAPGSNILSTTPNNTYSVYSGTSMATPHVAGAAALVWGQNPGLTYNQVMSRLLSSVDVKSSLAGVVATGGRLNVARALAAPVADTSGPRVISAAPDSTTSVSRIRVTFNEAINATSFTAADITQFTGPLGAISLANATVQAVAGSNNTQFDIVFPAQTQAGSYQLSFGPDITDLAGNVMDQTGVGSPNGYTAVFAVEATGTYNFASSSSASIRDLRTVSVPITVDRSLVITDLNVRVNITHTYTSDLRIYLQGPDGTTIDLVRYRGGSGDNFTDTVLDDEASQSIANGVAPYTGSFRPEQALSAFDGRNALGTWRLYVQDRARGDTGQLVSWELNITASTSSGGTASLGLSSASEALSLPQVFKQVTSTLRESGSLSQVRETLSNLAYWLVSNRAALQQVEVSRPAEDWLSRSESVSSSVSVMPGEDAPSGLNRLASQSEEQASALFTDLAIWLGSQESSF
ncbi:MAG: S8 family serine peptidase [Gemmataceae bacterium]